MAYLIIVVALIFIIVPIIAVLPSARQKEQMRMRNLARQAGVSVDLTSIDDPNPEQDKYITPAGRAIPPVLKVIAWRYQRRRSGGWRRLPEVTWRAHRNPDKSWHWSTEPSNQTSDALGNWLNRSLESLPEDVEQVEESGYNITVYWHERENGSEQAVLDFLRQCADLPLHTPDKEDDSF